MTEKLIYIVCLISGAVLCFICLGLWKAVTKKEIWSNGGVVDWIAALSAIGGLASVAFGISQSNEHKRWDNYNAMNNVYRGMFAELQTDDFKKFRNKCSSYDNLTFKEQAWIRSYYNLYVEEFDLDKAKLLPPKMMEDTISRGFKLNLREYPVIIEGFDVLISKQAFKNKPKFKEHVRSEISEVREKNNCDRKEIKGIDDIAPTQASTKEKLNGNQRR